MKTYQDLQNAGPQEKTRMDFILSAINDHKSSEMYRIASDAEEYDRQNNVTIMNYRKVLYTLSGQVVPDVYSPNHKIVSNFFNRFTTQENQYLLGNGMTLENPDNKAKLGTDFDQKLQVMGRNALVQGVSFGFWNVDHLETFKLTEFVPLYDETTGQLMAGIRFFQVAADKPLQMTLYEPDGFTEYIRDKEGTMSIREGKEKRAYALITVTSQADGEEVVGGMNYPSFPIVPMWGNPHKQSELVGLRQSIDAYDLIKSGFANDMDGAHIYWLLKNSGGMDDVDLANFLQRLNLQKIASVEDDSEITAHEISIPYESRVAYLDRLEQDMYNDYQALNVADITGGNKTATEINAAYQPFDNKVDQYEYCVLQFVTEILKLAGIEDNPTFTRAKVANQNDNMSTLLMAAPYLDDDYLVQKICAILGDPDAAQDILDRKAALDVSRLMAPAAEVTENGEGTEE
ncbi:MAG: phage portal protein [Bacteroidales bacterium]|nr:phage portal protein [Bacteroidales bacterium]